MRNETGIELIRRTNREIDMERLTDEQCREVLARLREIQKVEALSDHFVCRAAARCSLSTWQKIYKGTHRADKSVYAGHARNWMKDRAEKAERPILPYAETAVGRMIQRVCYRAWSMCGLAKVITPSGCGKTVSAREYCRRNPERSIYIQAGQALSSVTAVLDGLIAALPKCDTADGVPGKYRSIRKTLAELWGGGKGRPMIVLMDEATTLRPEAINVLRNLHDDPACGLAVVLLDTWRLDAELHSRGGIKGGYDQLNSRFCATYAVPEGREIALDDVRAVAESIAEGLGFEGRLHKDSVRYLHRLAQRPGKLRNVQFRLWTVRDVAEQQDREATYSPAELDCVAGLVGGVSEIPGSETAFSQGQSAPASKAAVA